MSQLQGPDSGMSEGPASCGPNDSDEGSMVCGAGAEECAHGTMDVGKGIGMAAGGGAVDDTSGAGAAIDVWGFLYITDHSAVVHPQAARPHVLHAAAFAARKVGA